MKKYNHKTISGRLISFRNPIAVPLKVDSLNMLKIYYKRIIESNMNERKKDMNCRLLLEAFLKQENLTIIKENLQFEYEMKILTNYDLNDSQIL